MPLVSFVKRVFDEYGKNQGSQLSAAFAYTAIFALAPFLLVIIGVVGLVFGQKAVQGHLFTQLKDVVGPSAASTIQSAIAHSHQSKHGVLALVLGTVVSLLAAGALTNQLQSSFDRVFAVVPDPKAGIKWLIYVKIKNAVLLIAGGLIIAASIIVTALITAVGTNLSNHFGLPKVTLQALNIAASLVIFMVVLYLLYRVLPDARLPRKVVFVAALIVSLLFLVGKIILGYVIGRNGTASAYGAAASLVTLLLWFYYTGQILLLGAEGIKVYANNRGIIYGSKKYTLKQKTVNIYTKNNIAGRAAELFARGFTRKMRNEQKPKK